MFVRVAKVCSLTSFGMDGSPRCLSASTTAFAMAKPSMVPDREASFAATVAATLALLAAFAVSWACCAAGVIGSTTIARGAQPENARHRMAARAFMG